MNTMHEGSYESAQAWPPQAAGPADVTDRLVLEDHTLAGFVRGRPAVAVGVALLLGFVAGRLASRFA